jgi:hypothetical protein
VNGNQTDNSASASGAAYVFVRDGTTWTQQAYLKASNTEAADNFGASVAVSGDTVVVGARFEDGNATGVNGNQGDNSAPDSGAAYIFVRDGTTWSQQAYLKASNTGAGDRFGDSVVVSGDTVVVAAEEEDSNATGVNGNQADNSAVGSGAAYVFTGLGVPGAPIIVLGPLDQSVFQGSDATFSVLAVGAPPLSYQWFFNETNTLAEATNTTYIIASVQPTHAGTYSVVVTNDLGAVTSRLAWLEVIPCAPVILLEPADQGVREGRPATFSVSVRGAPPLSYQWFFNETNALAGATNPTNSIASVQSTHVGTYSVVVTNVCGAVTSRLARLEIAWPPAIVQQPQPQTIVAGEDATFTVTVTNNAWLPIGYQWRKGTVPLTNIILYERTCSFTMYNVQTNVTTTSGPGDYRVVVTNAANYQPGLASSFARLTVITATPPTVLTLAASDVTASGATLRGTVNPNGATTRAWFEYGLSPSYGSSTPASNVGNGTNAVELNLPITELLPGTYHYQVVATNSGGSSVGGDLVFETGSLPPAPTIESCALLGDGCFHLQFTGQPGASYMVLGSTNLVDWGELGPATETSPGQFEFTDTAAPDYETRYYKLRSP